MSDTENIADTSDIDTSAAESPPEAATRTDSAAGDGSYTLAYFDTAAGTHELWCYAVDENYGEYLASYSKTWNGGEIVKNYRINNYNQHVSAGGSIRRYGTKYLSPGAYIGFSDIDDCLAATWGTLSVSASGTNHYTAGGVFSYYTAAAGTSAVYGGDACAAEWSILISSDPYVGPAGSVWLISGDAELTETQTSVARLIQTGTPYGYVALSPASVPLTASGIYTIRWRASRDDTYQKYTVSTFTDSDGNTVKTTETADGDAYTITVSVTGATRCSYVYTGGSALYWNTGVGIIALTSTAGGSGSGGSSGSSGSSGITAVGNTGSATSGGTKKTASTSESTASAEAFEVIPAGADRQANTSSLQVAFKNGTPAYASADSTCNATRSGLFTYGFNTSTIRHRYATAYWRTAKSTDETSIDFPDGQSASCFVHQYPASAAQYAAFVAAGEVTATVTIDDEAYNAALAATPYILAPTKLKIAASAGTYFIEIKTNCTTVAATVLTGGAWLNAAEPSALADTADTLVMEITTTANTDTTARYAEIELEASNGNESAAQRVVIAQAATATDNTDTDDDTNFVFDDTAAAATLAFSPALCTAAATEEWQWELTASSTRNFTLTSIGATWLSLQFFDSESGEYIAADFETEYSDGATFLATAAENATGTTRTAAISFATVPADAEEETSVTAGIVFVQYGASDTTTATDDTSATQFSLATANFSLGSESGTAFIRFLLPAGGTCTLAVDDDAAEWITLADTTITDTDGEEKSAAFDFTENTETESREANITLTITDTDGNTQTATVTISQAAAGTAETITLASDTNVITFDDAGGTASFSVIVSDAGDAPSVLWIDGDDALIDGVTIESESVTNDDGTTTITYTLTAAANTSQTALGGTIQIALTAADGGASVNLTITQAAAPRGVPAYFNRGMPALPRGNF